MSGRRSLALLAFAIVVVAAAVWAVGEEQRRTVGRSFGQSQAAQAMLTAMLDQETGMRGYVQTRRESFLVPFRTGNRAFARATVDAHRATADLGPEVAALVGRGERTGLEWQSSAQQAVTEIQSGRLKVIPLRDAQRRKTDMDAFRAANDALRARLDVARDRSLRRLQFLSSALVVAIATLFAAGGWFLFGRPAERERRRKIADGRRRERQTEFARTMQMMDGEVEAHTLVRRHLERELPGATVAVLQHDAESDPRACMAVRLGRPHAEAAGEQLLSCERCGHDGTARAVCTPLLVSGEVIGSVLVEHDAPLDEGARETVDDTVTQAAPVLANMRTLALAERQAATDALTGLPNRRSVDDTVRRMVAQAHRTGTPLAVLAIDIDHFKRVNDRHGHDRGDEVLVAVARALSDCLRVSDFVGRPGGEEFLALLPDTALSGALTAAENLRAAVEALDLPGLDRPVTVSLGVAVLPDDGSDAATILRAADRALYAAKDRGRNRVEVSGTGVASPQTAG